MKTIELTPLMRVIIGFDLLVTAWLALPGAAGLFLDLLDALGRWSGLAPPIEPFDPLQLFMVNLAGILGVTWNWTRWHTASYDLAKIDAVARIAVAALIVYYVVAMGATPVLLLFMVSELSGSAVEFRLRPRAGSA